MTDEASQRKPSDLHAPHISRREVARLSRGDVHTVEVWLRERARLSEEDTHELAVWLHQRARVSELNRRAVVLAGYWDYIMWLVRRQVEGFLSEQTVLAILVGLQAILAGLPLQRTGLPREVVEVQGLAVKAHRQNIAGFTPAQLLMLVLIWLVLLAEPAAVLKLSRGVQEVVNGDFGTVSLAVALTVIIASQRKGGAGK